MSISWAKIWLIWFSPTRWTCSIVSLLCQRATSELHNKVFLNNPKNVDGLSCARDDDDGVWLLHKMIPPLNWYWCWYFSYTLSNDIFANKMSSASQTFKLSSQNQHNCIHHPLHHQMNHIPSLASLLAELVYLVICHLFFSWCTQLAVCVCQLEKNVAN